MKIKRHSKIIELVNENDIETQEELAELLKKSGFNVTQATVSRDIRELNLTKITTPLGKQKYSLLKSKGVEISDRAIRVFSDGLVSINYANNIIVIKTLSGMAMAVASGLDSMENVEILGSIAGDDTIFCVVKDEQKVISLIDKLKSIINQV